MLHCPDTGRGWAVAGATTTPTTAVVNSTTTTTTTVTTPTAVVGGAQTPTTATVCGTGTLVGAASQGLAPEAFLTGGILTIETSGTGACLSAALEMPRPPARLRATVTGQILAPPTLAELSASLQQSLEYLSLRYVEPF